MAAYNATATIGVEVLFLAAYRGFKYVFRKEREPVGLERMRDSRGPSMREPGGTRAPVKYGQRIAHAVVVSATRTYTPA